MEQENVYKLVFDYGGISDREFTFISSVNHLSNENEILAFLEANSMVSECLSKHPDIIENGCYATNIRLLENGTAVFPKPKSEN